MAAKGKILVVDDDRLVLATVTHGLKQAGYEVVDADNGDDAILLAHQHRPDLALLDIRMEGKSGFDVAAYLRESLRVPYMFLSAFADPATVTKVAELGAVAYLVKPLDVSQIVPTVDAQFERIRAQRGAAATPPAVIKKLEQALMAVTRQPEVRQALLKQGAAAVGSSARELDKVVKAEIPLWQSLTKEASIKID